MCNCPDPIRGGDNILVMCEVSYVDMTPHATNTRAACAKAAKKFAEQEPLFGIEQEYTMLEPERPPARVPRAGLPGAAGPVLLRRRHRPHHGS